MRRHLMLIVLLFLPATVARAQAPPEFLVNTYTTGPQSGRAAAMDSSGNFVIAWSSSEQDGSGSGIFGQRFDASGAPLGSEFQVNTYTTGSQAGPSVGMDPSGRFVVVWSSEHDGSDRDVFAQRFDVDGSPLGSEFQVNEFTTGPQASADVAIDDQGNFIVVWQSGAIFNGARIRGRRFDVSGSPLGSEFQASQLTLDGSIAPAVAMNGAGEFVASWRDVVVDNYGDFSFDVRYRPYDSSGAPLCGARLVAPGYGYFQGGHDVAMVPSGDSLVTWSKFSTEHSYDVWVRRYHGCNPVSSGMRVNTYTDESQSSPTVVADAAGNYIVAWNSPQDGSESGIFAQRFDGDDNPVGTEYQVNTFTTDDQLSPVTAMNGNGSLVVTWSSYGQDGSGWGVYARGPDAISGTALSVDIHPSDDMSSNLNGLLEEGETVRIEPAFRNSRSSDLDLAGTALALTGPPGPIYAIDDDSADYGTIPAGGSAGCADATGDCFEVSVMGPRPAQHWDALLDETLSADDAQTWTLHVGGSFLDVPTTHLFYTYVENILHHSVTEGCGSDSYCPADPVRRDQMAVFLLKAIHGASYVPPGCYGWLLDVPCPSQFADWVEQLVREDITVGCGGSHYCPSNPVTRAQMAAFLLKAKHGPSYVPPACKGVFLDVPCSSPFAPWIEQLSRESITAGCGGGNYCPNGSITRGQMAVFLVKTFGLRLYGP